MKIQNSIKIQFVNFPECSINVPEDQNVQGGSLRLRNESFVKLAVLGVVSSSSAIIKAASTYKDLQLV